MRCSRFWDQVGPKSNREAVIRRWVAHGNVSPFSNKYVIFLDVQIDERRQEDIDGGRRLKFHDLEFRRAQADVRSFQLVKLFAFLFDVSADAQLIRDHAIHVHQLHWYRVALDDVAADSLRREINLKGFAVILKDAVVDAFIRVTKVCRQSFRHRFQHTRVPDATHHAVVRHVVAVQLD